MDKKEPTLKAKIAAGVVLIVLFLLLWAFMTSDNTNESEPQKDANYSKAVSCAEETLRSTYTTSNSLLEKIDAWKDLTATGDGSWTVTGSVNALNTSGIELEANFTCNDVKFSDSSCQADCVSVEELQKK